MSDIKISVVVPVYNTEKYLKECLDSLINQSLKEIEIICVNDGSTDTSLEILEEYAKNDSRIRIINQENQGVSAARNRGIKEAKGEYLTFVDSDDLVELNALEILYTTAVQRGSEMLLFAHKHYFEDGRKPIKNCELKDLKSKIGDNNTTFLESYQLIFNTPMGTCSKLYRTNFLQDNNVIYPVGLQAGEDRSFYIQACIHAKSISVLDEDYYLYRRTVSTSLSRGHLKTVEHMYISNQIIKEMLYKFPEAKKMHCAFLRDYIRHSVWAWNISEDKIDKAYNIKYMKKLKKECLQFKKSPDFPADQYVRLLNIINKYDRLFFQKLIEPFIEIEKREKRFAIYLFEHQLINIPI